MIVRLRFAAPTPTIIQSPEPMPLETRQQTQLYPTAPLRFGPTRAGGFAQLAAAALPDAHYGPKRRDDADQRPKAPYARTHRTLRLDSPTRTPLGWAAVNGQSTSCAAFRPKFVTATQTQSRVNLDQTAGP